MSQSGIDRILEMRHSADLATRQTVKKAGVIALAVHFALFLVVFPEMGSTQTMEEQRQAVVIKRYKPPEPPKQQPEKKVVKKKTARVPIPDPTPDDPEPIVDDNVEYIESGPEERAETEFLVSGPVGGPPQPPVQEGPIQVGGEVKAPEKLCNVEPTYPELALRARMQGVVILNAIIDREGQVTHVEVLRGLGLGLDQAAVDAVEQWCYTPTFYNGRPVEISMTVTVQFQLQ